MAETITKAQTKTAGPLEGTSAHHGMVAPGEAPFAQEQLREAFGADEQNRREVAVQAKDFSVWYATNEAVKKVTLDFKERFVTAIIGPSGCGKSTLLRAINRMNDLIPGCHVTGELLVDSRNIYSPGIDVVALRRAVGMVFQQPNVFPKTIFDNVAYGPRLQGGLSRAALSDLVETSLRRAALWDEVKDRLRGSALSLSGGQQQRLCIARALAVGPEVVLMDEPASALDPQSTARIEALIDELRKEYTIIIVTHNMQQAARISDFTAFLYEGRLIEYGATKQVFTNPVQRQTEDYITGRFG